MAVPITPAMQNSIANLYIAILGRNPEPAGFSFWVDSLANNNGTSAALQQITLDFSKSPEFQATYGGQPTQTAVALMYQNVLNRAADAGGLAFWSGVANNFIAQGFTIAQAYALTGNQLIIGAANNAGTTDATNIAAKQVAAVAAGTTTPTTTVTLTTDIEALTIGSNTTVIGVVADVAAQATTLQAGDTITGTGTGNILRAVDTSTAAVPAPLAGVALSGVQTLQVQSLGQATTYNLAGITGVTTVTSFNSLQNTTFQNLGANTVVGITGNSATPTGLTTTAGFTAVPTAVSMSLNGGVVGQTLALAAGTAPTTVTLASTGGTNGIGVGGVTTLAAGGGTQSANAVTFGGSGSVTSLNINAATNLRATLNTADFSAAGAALVVSGAAAGVNLIGAGAAANGGTWSTVNASGLTAGGVSINASNTLTSFIGGTGNDTVRSNTAAGGGTTVIAATANIDAGAGTDTLQATLVNVANGAVFKNFEVLDLRGLGNVAFGGTADQALLTNSTITGVAITGGLAASVVVNNLVATATGFNATVGATAGGAGTTTTLNFTPASILGTANIVNFNFNNTNATAATVVNAREFVIQGIEIVNINSGGVPDIANFLNTVALNSNALQTITVTGSQRAVISVEVQNVVGAATATALTTINASGMTGTQAGLNFTEALGLDQTAAVLPTVAISGLTISGSSAADNISVSTVAPVVGTSFYSSDVVNISQGGLDVVNVVRAFTNIQAAPAAGAADSFGFTTITGAGAADAVAFAAVLDFGALGVAANVAAATSLFGALTAAADQAVGAGDGNLSWFNLGGNTYIVQDNGAGAGLDTADIVVALTGTYNLALSTTVAGGTLTIV